MSEETSFKEDLKVDKYNLEIEWEELPSLIEKWGRKYANAVYERDKAKMNVDVVKAEQEMKIRKDPEVYGIQKVTNDAVNAILTTSDQIRKAEDALLNANKEVNLLAVARDGITGKKKALEMETELFLSGYFVRLKVPKEAIEKDQERRSKNQLDNLEEGMKDVPRNNRRGRRERNKD